MARNERNQRRPQRDSGGHRTVLWLVNGVLAGVGGVFVSTASTVVTAIAAAAAVVIVVTVIVVTRRLP
ncbi:hypothetical protein EEZ25_24415 [Micromonospora aurantiaca]|uniref:hypothetical protein n=1 Tax=Micromonospora aurantiaca (nom. illeg.) TaxID=47850 RepID=UPI000F3F62A2|nr:hypothetical protein [Micromonospora aurantiaca]RNH98847.1 hypothetical protein EEZ25_24415 [Micromonospora aurantiaca]